MSAETAIWLKILGATVGALWLISVFLLRSWFSNVNDKLNGLADGQTKICERVAGVEITASRNSEELRNHSDEIATVHRRVDRIVNGRRL